MTATIYLKALNTRKTHYFVSGRLNSALCSTGLSLVFGRSFDPEWDCLALQINGSRPHQKGWTKLWPLVANPEYGISHVYWLDKDSPDKHFQMILSPASLFFYELIKNAGLLHKPIWAKVIYGKNTSS